MIVTTPEVLQTRFQMPAEVGRPRALANIFFAYEGRRRRRMGWGVCDVDDGRLLRVLVSNRGANQAAAKLNQRAGRDRYLVVESELDAARPAHERPSRKDYVPANQKKFRFLISAIILTVTKALPEDDEEWKRCDQVSQADLADVAGLKRRETITRWLSQYSPLAAVTDRYWHIVDRTTGKIVRRRITKEKAEAWCQVQNMEAGEERYSAEPRDRHLLDPEILLLRSRQFTAPNFYRYAGLPTAKVSWAVETESGVFVKGFRRKEKAEQFRDRANAREQGPRLKVVMRELEESRFHAPTLAQLHDDPRFDEFFAASGRYHGFTLLPGWLWHEGSKLSVKARLVMTYYIFCGLFKKNALGRPVGEVHPHQDTVARATGLSTKSVYLANRELAAAGLIRVYHPKPRRQPNGSYTNGPASILYLPIRMLSQEEADEERKRFQERLGRTRDAAVRAKAQTIHEELLASWTGKEHCLMAFWRETARRFAAEGIHQSVINALLPLPPE